MYLANKILTRFPRLLAKHLHIVHCFLQWSTVAYSGSLWLTMVHCVLQWFTVSWFTYHHKDCDTYMAFFPVVPLVRSFLDRLIGVYSIVWGRRWYS